MQISKIFIGSISVLALLALTGCEDKGKTEVKEVAQEVVKETKEAAAKQGNIDMHGGKENAQMQDSTIPAGVHSGTIIEVLDADPYTYINVKTENGDVWVAVPRVSVEKGIKVSFNENMRVVDFESKTLGRTFDVVIFSNEIQSDAPIEKVEPTNPHTKVDENVSTTAAVPAVIETPDATDKNISTAAPTPTASVEGALTIEQIYAKKDELKGKTIKVVGEVKKASAAIMGKNWIHIQDGTGAEGNNDLIFTSITDLPAVGDKVVAEGKLATDQDLGYGYFFAVIIEESTFSKK